MKWSKLGFVILSSILLNGFLGDSFVKAASPLDGFLAETTAKEANFCGVNRDSQLLDLLNPDAETWVDWSGATYDFQLERARNAYNRFNQAIKADGSWGITIRGIPDDSNQVSEYGEVTFFVSDGKLTAKLANQPLDTYPRIEQSHRDSLIITGTSIPNNYAYFTAKFECVKSKSDLGKVKITDFPRYDGEVSDSSFNNMRPSFNLLALRNSDTYTSPVAYPVTGTKLFLFYGNVEYPEGYEGPPVRSSIKVEKELIPDFSWQLTPRGKLTVNYENNLEIFKNGEYNQEDYGWKIKIVRDDSDWSKTNHVGLLEKLEFDLPTINKTYSVYMTLEKTNPNALDVNVQNTGFRVNFNGQLQSGSTHDCDDGLCFNYEDLSCENKPNLTERLNCEIQAEATKSSHGLSSVLVAPLGFFSQLSNQACQPITYNLFNEQRTIPCLGSSINSVYPTLVTIWQTVITGLVAYLVGVNIFHRVKKVSDPKDDSIEVAKL